MKKTILIVAIALISNLTFSQNFTELTTHEFKTVESYKAGENDVLLCANFLFNNPSNTQELNRLLAFQHILKWMEGTPSHTFEIDKKSLELTKGNDDLLGLYMAAMTKVVLEHEGDKLANEEIYSKAEELLVNYCADSNNKMKPSKKIKKLLKARKNKS